MYEEDKETWPQYSTSLQGGTVKFKSFTLQHKCCDFLSISNVTLSGNRKPFPPSGQSFPRTAFLLTLLAPIPTQIFFPKHVMFSSPLLPEAKLNAEDNSDKMTRCSPRSTLSILTPCLPKKEVLQAQQQREPHSSHPTTLLNAAHPGHFQSLFCN